MHVSSGGGNAEKEKAGNSEGAKRAVRKGRSRAGGRWRTKPHRGRKGAR